MPIIEWSEPRPERSNLVFSAEVVAELKQRPNQWGLVRVYNHHGSPNRTKCPAGVEMRVVWREKAGKRRSSELWGRWVG